MPRCDEFWLEGNARSRGSIGVMFELSHAEALPVSWNRPILGSHVSFYRCKCTEIQYGGLTIHAMYKSLKDIE